jgi:hypothetical protein
MIPVLKHHAPETPAESEGIFDRSRDDKQPALARGVENSRTLISGFK